MSEDPERKMSEQETGLKLVSLGFLLRTSDKHGALAPEASALVERLLDFLRQLSNEPEVLQPVLAQAELRDINGICRCKRCGDWCLDWERDSEGICLPSGDIIDGDFICIPCQDICELEFDEGQCDCSTVIDTRTQTPDGD